MTLTTNDNLTTYDGDGVTVDFDTEYKFYDDTDLVVTLIDDSVRTLQTLNSDYTITGGDGATGTVTFGTAPTSDDEVEIVRTIPLTQTSQFRTASKFPSAAHEESLDRIVMMIQQLDEEIGRAVLRPRGSALGDSILPDPEAYNHLAWAADETSIINVDPDEGSCGSPVRWEVKTADFTAETEEGYVCDTDTAAAAITATLPATPATGDQVSIIKVGSSYNVILDRNGSNIMGAASNYTLDQANQSLHVTYAGASLGWRVAWESPVGSYAASGHIVGLDSKAGSSTYEVDVAAGEIEVNGTSVELSADTYTLTDDIPSPSANAWYVLTTDVNGDVEFAAVADYSWDASRLGWYNAGGTRRAFVEKCGLAYTNATPDDILVFSAVNGEYFFDDTFVYLLDTASPATSETALASLIPYYPCRAMLNAYLWSSTNVARIVYVGTNGTNSRAVINDYQNSSSASHGRVTTRDFMLAIDGSGNFYYHINNATDVTSLIISLVGFKAPASEA